MADGSCGTLSRADEKLIREALRERWRLKREASALSDTNLARKFGVPRVEITKLRQGRAWTRAARVEMGPRDGTHCARMLAVLREGPATAAEISVSLAMNVRNVVAQLHDLEKRALVRSRPFHTDDNLTHKTVKLYSLPEHAR